MDSTMKLSLSLLSRGLEVLLILVPVCAWTADAPDPTPSSSAGSIDLNLPTQPRLGRFVEHISQMKLLRLVRDRNPIDAFEFAREKGDDFFDNLFIADELFGVGAHVG